MNRDGGLGGETAVGRDVEKRSEITFGGLDGHIASTAFVKAQDGVRPESYRDGGW